MLILLKTFFATFKYFELSFQFDSDLFVILRGPKICNSQISSIVMFDSARGHRTCFEPSKIFGVLFLIFLTCPFFLKVLILSLFFF